MLLVSQPMISGFIQFIQDAALFDLHNNYYRLTKLLFNNMVFFLGVCQMCPVSNDQGNLFCLLALQCCNNAVFLLLYMKKLLPRAIFAKISSQTTHSW